MFQFYFQILCVLFPFLLLLKTSNIKLSGQSTLKSWQKCIRWFQEDKIEEKVRIQETY